MKKIERTRAPLGRFCRFAARELFDFSASFRAFLGCRGGCRNVVFVTLHRATDAQNGNTMNNSNNSNNSTPAHKDTPVKWRVLKAGTGLTRRTGLALDGDMGTGTTWAKWSGGAVVTVSNKALVFVIAEGTLSKAFVEHVASTWRKGATVSVVKSPAGTPVLVATPARRATKAGK